jgi:mRNA interferase RelE/StbE
MGDDQEGVEPFSLNYTIEFTPAAQRQFNKLPYSAQDQIGRKIETLKVNPRHEGVVKLKEGKDLYRIRSGDYRVIYKIEDDRLIVLIVKVADRKDAYR